MRFRFHSSRLAALAFLAEKNQLTMAVPVDKSPDTTVPVISTDDLRVQLNNVITALRIVTAKLDLDAGVTDVNYTALAMDAAIPTAPIRIKGS
jgi:hypothetical protein